MSRKNLPERRPSWRDRFLEIARQVEGAGERAAAPRVHPRARMAGFALVRRARGGSMPAA